MANITCENCNGRGRVPVETDRLCENCSGTGMQSSKAWTFHLPDMEVVESEKGENETTMRFGTPKGPKSRDRGDSEVVCKIDWPWPAGKQPPVVGSRYSIDFRSIEEEAGE